MTTKIIRANVSALHREVPGEPTRVPAYIHAGPASLLGRVVLVELDAHSTRWLAEQLLLRAVERTIPTHGLSLGEQRTRRERATLYVRGVFDEACAIARDGTRA